MVEREHRGGNEERGRLERSWFLSLRHGFLCSFENWRRRWSTCLLHSSAIHLLCSDINAYKDSMGTNRSKTERPPSEKLERTRSSFFPLPTLSSVTMQGGRKRTAFPPLAHRTSLSLRLPENCSIVPVQRDSRRKRDEKRARTEPIGRVFSLALFHQNGTSTTCIQPRRWRQRSQEDCQDLARARAPPRRLGPRRRLRAPVEEPRSRR